MGFLFFYIKKKKKQYHDEEASKRFGGGNESIKQQSLHDGAYELCVVLKAETLNLHCPCLLHCKRTWVLNNELKPKRERKRKETTNKCVRETGVGPVRVLGFKLMSPRPIINFHVIVKETLYNVLDKSMKRDSLWYIYQNIVLFLSQIKCSKFIQILPSKVL